MTIYTMSSRYFNHVTYDSDQQTVRKSSENEPKLIDEIQWYLQLPEQLKGYAPTILDYSLERGNVYLTMEFLEFPSLTNLMVRDEHSASEWEKIFNRIFEFIEALSRNSGKLEMKDLEFMYVTKTRQRLTSFLEYCSFAKSIWKKGYYKLNGVTMLCPIRIFEQHMKEVRALFEQAPIHVIHGDLCFSNLFYDADRDKVRVIDPRGNFGKAGIYGDARYDLAKVRHSLSGYEYLMNDAFDIRFTQGNIDLNLPPSSLLQSLMETWDCKIGKELRAVRLIESLLFLSMLPLHRDRPDRQLAMYSIGTKLLYEALEN